MARCAPELPTTDELHIKYPLAEVAGEVIAQQRYAISSILTGQRDGLFAVIGPCAMTTDKDILNSEGSELSRVAKTTPKLVIAQRMPPWKPRTNPDDWHGMETESDTVEQAFSILAGHANADGNVAIEIGLIQHISRYAAYLTPVRHKSLLSVC